MNVSYPMTAGGLQALRDELDNLKKTERPAVIKAIASAREHGDLSENAEYHAAREKQSFIETRIQHLEDQVANAQVIDVRVFSGDRVKFGAIVDVIDEDSGKKLSYRILGAEEANIEKGELSIDSPLARALINRQVGDQVEVNTPNGVRVYEIAKVHFD